MNEVAVEQGARDPQTKISQESFNWKDNPHIQKLLDVVVSIMAEEYVQVAKKNPDVFMDSRFRGNDSERR